MGKWKDSNNQYTFHGKASDDVVNVLVCQIRVWEAKQSDNSDAPADAALFTEVSNIEINDSYKNLVSTATITIPRGAVIARTIQKGVNKSVKTGNMSKEAAETKMSSATENGQISQEGSSVDKDGVSTLSIDGIRPDMGFVEMKKEKNEQLIDKNDFAIGNRVEIKLGWFANDGTQPDDPNDDVFARARRGENLGLSVCFRGFVTGCSVSSPLVITCEGMGSKLKKVRCPNIIAKQDYTINDLFKSGGKFDLLKGTGIELSPDTSEMDINVGKINMSTNITVADVCSELSKCGLTCFIEPNGKYLRIARVLYSGISQDKNKSYVSYSKNNNISVIQFDWDVAVDGLTISRIDKNFLAVKAQAWFHSKDDGSNHLMRVTLRRAQADEEGAEDGFMFSNEHIYQPKKVGKKVGGTNTTPKNKNYSQLENYTIIPYISPNRNITMKELKNEAKAYFKRYGATGISGTITVFGDREISPSECVLLLDARQPEKIGIYLVESVTTTFGMNGYRRELKLPYKILDYTGAIRYIDDND